MQQWTTDGTRLERTGWRDEGISKRHRRWGFNCPAVDLDFLMVEYNLGLPVGLVEYKHHQARTPDVRHATYRALTSLADGYAKDGKADPLPFLVAFYWPDVWAFRVTPVNEAARRAFSPSEVLSEYEYVRRLYRLRRLTLSKELSGVLNREVPAMEEAS